VEDLVAFTGKEVIMSWSVRTDFKRIGVRVDVALVPNETVVRCHCGHFPPVRVSVTRDRRGPCFVIERRWTVTVNVAQVDVAARQLLLVADHFRYGAERYSRILCGHAAGDWFAVAVPTGARVWTVDAARAALEPPIEAAATRELAASFA
jgi:hypothetical protein